MPTTWKQDENGMGWDGMGDKAVDREGGVRRIERGMASHYYTVFLLCSL